MASKPKTITLLQLVQLYEKFGDMPLEIYCRSTFPTFEHEFVIKQTLAYPEPEGGHTLRVELVQTGKFWQPKDGEV